MVQILSRGPGNFVHFVSYSPCISSLTWCITTYSLEKHFLTSQNSSITFTWDSDFSFTDSYMCLLSSVQLLSHVQLCDPMNCSASDLPVHHQLLEFTQTHVHWVGDAIQPSHPLSSPSPPAPIPPRIRVFSNESTFLMRWPKFWSFSFSISPSSEQPGLISFRMDSLDLCVSTNKL